MRREEAKEHMIQAACYCMEGELLGEQAGLLRQWLETNPDELFRILRRRAPYHYALAEYEKARELLPAEAERESAWREACGFLIGLWEWRGKEEEP